MIQDVRVPEISENVEKGDVASILVSVGDTVEADQGLLELETDKAVVELPAPSAGKISEILIKEGDTVNVGDVVMKIDADSAKAEEPEEKPGDAEKSDSQPKAEEAPADEPEAEQDEAPAKAESEEPAKESKPAPAPSRPAAKASKPAPRKDREGDPIPAGPAVRKLARELGIDLYDIGGSGPRGRILEDDVKQHAKNVIEHSTSVAYTMPDLSQFGPVRHEPMSKLRQLTAEAMARANAMVPQVTQFQKADISELEKFRAQYAKHFAKQDVKLTPTAIVMKIAAEALKKFPNFNAAIDMDAGEIIYRDYIHMSIAVDTDRGLLVPVIRDVDQKDLVQLAKDLGEISSKARAKKLGPADMEGGSFTISNQGSIGGEWFTPIVNPPQVAILGMSRSLVEPRWIDEKWQPRTVLPLTLSYDHRIVDGADASRFLDWICKALENPMAMFV
ncbi:2-oxo acid dehydrogenase subunit E2 [bacterium]|nr:2-oxo acid dehydrogenase subunit E2 [bacterium]